MLKALDQESKISSGIYIPETAYEVKKVIIAIGSSPRLLNVPGEEEFIGSGISYCATCDGEFYKDKDIIVIRGGNHAMEESLLLLQYVNSIIFTNHFDALQVEKAIADSVMQNPRVKILWSHEPRKFEKRGDKIITTAEKPENKELNALEPNGIFVFVGMIPNTDLFKSTPL